MLLVGCRFSLDGTEAILVETMAGSGANGFTIRGWAVNCDCKPALEG